MRRKLGYLLYACGRDGLPEQIMFRDTAYRLRQVFKHDFFAATALYDASGQPHTKKAPAPARIVLKLNRRNHFFGLPLAWLGEVICSHEVSVLRRLSNVDEVPHLLSNYGKTGFMYEYIEGRCLKEQKELPDNFFDELLVLLKKIHRRNIVYLDMNKRSNIILGSDGRPYLIDFQISLHIGERLLFSRRLSGYLRECFQRADIYHLLKHKRRLCPQLLQPQEKELSHSISWLIRAHRLVATPLRKLRRNFLKFLSAKGMLDTQEDSNSSREDDTARITQ